MKSPDVSGMLRWPNVPACYGWLSLDRRGQWRMQNDPVVHHGLIAFLNRQYAHDEQGNYFVQNGPQRVFVELDYTPWVLRLSSENTLLPQNQRLALETHTGEPVKDILSVAFDEEGNLLLELPEGIALLCDRDLAAFLGCLRQANGEAADDAALLDLLAQTPGTLSTLTLQWQEQRLPVHLLRRAEVSQRYGFVSKPSAPPKG
jgi:hypothetical protein